MKIALIGASGHIGTEIAKQLESRSHTVTALTRPGKSLPPSASARAIGVDLFDTDALAEAIQGHDILASAYAPPQDKLGQISELTNALIAAARKAGVKRLVVVGGAGSLEVAPGLQLVDTPQFPEAYKGIALAHRAAFNVLREASDLDWTSFAPAAMIGPGDKQGGYRVGASQLLTNAKGESAISYADYAEAFVTELEQGAHRRQLVTLAYQ